MISNTKRMLAAAAAGVMALAMCGCSIQVGTNRQLSDDTIVAKPVGEAIEGKESLSVDYLTFKKEYLFWLNSQQITDDSAEGVAAECMQQRETIINYLVNEQIIKDKAREFGVDTFTEEELAAIDESFQAQLDEQIAFFAQNADFGTLETGESISEEQRLEKGGELFDEYLAQSLVTRDDLLMWERSAALAEKVKTAVAKDIVLDRSEAQAQYDGFVETVKATYESDPAAYEADPTYSAFWVPEGARRIKHILLKFEDTVIDEIAACRENGDGASADKLREEALAALEQEKTEIINMLDNGGSFDEIMLEYTDDTNGIIAYPEGYLVLPNGQNYVAEFQAGAFELENIGDYKAVATDLGWHIMLYASDAKISQESIDGYVDIVYDTMLENAADQAFNLALEEWKEEYAYEIDYEALKIDRPAEDTDSDAAAS